MSDELQKIETPAAPKPIGPYSQAVNVPSSELMVYVSGQIPINPKTGQMVDENITSATRQTIDNIEAILKASGSDLERVVRVEIFLKNLERDFVLMNEEYIKRFTGKVLPARQVIQAAALPKDAMIEMSCIAIA